MPQSSSLTPTMIALSFPAAAAVILTALRPRLRPDLQASRRLSVVVGLTIIGHVVHFAEELSTELYIQFPTTFGYPAAPESVFISSNMIALAVWVVALAAVRSGIVIGLLPLWFLAFCMLLNLVLHPYLALRAGGYYSGVLTAPLVGSLGILMVRELVRVTSVYRRSSNSSAG